MPSFKESPPCGSGWACGLLVAFPLAGPEGPRLGVLVGWFRAAQVPPPKALRGARLSAVLASLVLEREQLREQARRSMEARTEAERAEGLRLSRFQAVTEGFSRALTRHEVSRVVLNLGLPALGAQTGLGAPAAPRMAREWSSPRRWA